MDKKQILVIDSNPGTLVVARNVLARAGFGVVTSSSLTGGLRRVFMRTPDLILIDEALLSPETEIEDLLPPSVPLIFSVPAGHTKSARRRLQSGALIPPDGCSLLEKPFDVNQLVCLIETNLFGESTPPDGIEWDRNIHNNETIEDERDLDMLDTQEEPVESLLPQALVEAISQAAAESPTDEIAPAIPKTPRNRSVHLAAMINELLPLGLVDGSDDLNRLEAICERAYRSHVGDKETTRIPLEQQGEVVMTGHLGAVSLDQILQMTENLAADVACCTVERNSTLPRNCKQVAIYFDRRAVVFASQMNLPEGHLLGRYLVSIGAIKQGELNTFLEQQDDGVLGERLVRAGLVTERQVSQCLVRQTADLVFEALRWKEARFSVIAGVHAPHESRQVSIRFSLARLLLNGLKRLDDWNRYQDEMGGLGAVPSRIDRSDEAQVLESLGNTQKLVLTNVDGVRNVQEIVRRTRHPAFDVCKVLAELRGQRLVTVEARIH